MVFWLMIAVLAPTYEGWALWHRSRFHTKDPWVNTISSGWWAMQKMYWFRWVLWSTWIVITAHFFFHLP